MKFCLHIFCFCCFSAAGAQLPAFPGAEGFGRYATGGRGGQVVKVTNLNDSGEGSFRWALTQFPDEPLTVIFTVGGLIELQSNIAVKRSNLTIAGQTAPGDGICLKNYSFIVNGASAKGNHGNIIIRFIRSRPGGIDKKGLYGFDMENCHDVIIDHCSFSWANEECAAMYDTKNTSFQWCIVSEGLYSAGHMKGNRSYGGVWGGQNASYHHNLIAHQNNRAARFNGARAHDTIALVDYRNNVIYNWGNANACYGGEVNIAGGKSQVNLINNYYKPGPAAPVELKFVHASYQKENSKGTGEWYAEGNIMEGESYLTKKNKRGIDLAEAGFPSNAIKDEPFAVAVPITLQSAKDAYESVLKNAGACLPKRDAVDERVILETRTGTASGKGVFGKPGIIDLPYAVGGWPVYQSGPAPADKDGDGMPDDWEIKKGLNPNDAADRNQKDKTGYTMLEIWLNEITGPLK
ncbi:MAG TPA: pectate lyase [Chitinophagaceae bacterium]|nr:pectate lyase [Chitinophagaceae bacterium]HRG91298.1 pectate lyase [Chitinophagaceae bacterium]